MSPGSIKVSCVPQRSSIMMTVRRAGDDKTIKLTIISSIIQKITLSYGLEGLGSCLGTP